MAKTLVRYQGATLPRIYGTFEDEDGDAIVDDLSSYTMSATLINLQDGTTQDVTGSFTVEDGAENTWNLLLAEADTADLAAGGWRIRIKGDDEAGGVFYVDHEEILSLKAL